MTNAINQKILPFLHIFSIVYFEGMRTILKFMYQYRNICRNQTRSIFSTLFTKNIFLAEHNHRRRKPP